MDKKFLLMIFILLIVGLFFSTNVSTTEECADADYIFNVDMWVVGEGCFEPPHTEDSVTLHVDKGKYKVEAKSHRGHPDQTQTNEAFFLEINGQDSFISEDDADPDAETVRWEDFGEFDFVQGNNDVIMHTDAQCPPDTTPNSVELLKICLYEVEETPEPFCGNKIVEAGEECDRGSVNGNVCVPGYESTCNYCSAECELIWVEGPFCGDGHKDAPHEECDGSDGVGPNQVCNAECELIDIPHCGNGIVEEGEQCDDGNKISGDGCSSSCVIEEPEPFCGDGNLDSGEECDHGKVNGNVCVPGYESTCNYCSADCKIITVVGPFCGDGILDSSESEECDDGNTVSGDGCSSSCQIEEDDDDKDKKVRGIDGGKTQNLIEFFCVPNWECTAWSECFNGATTRVCEDVNNCGIEYNKPIEQAGCELPKSLVEETERVSPFNIFLFLGILITLILIIILVVLIRA